MEQRVIPAFRMTDYARAKAFYTEKLGFAVDWEHRFEPGFPVFMQVRYHGMLLYLSEHTGDCQPGGLAHFIVPDVDAVHADFIARGAPILQPPSNDLPGLRMMCLADPDGNQLRFMTRQPRQS